MKRLFLLTVLIAGLILSGCQSKTETPADTESVSSVSLNCYNDACVKAVYANVDEEYFIVLLDITPIEGLRSADIAPQVTNPMQVVIKGQDGTEYVNATYTQEQYYCYAGKDVPWANGILTATCGIGIPVSEVAAVPQAGDQIDISLPDFNNYHTSVTVGNDW